MKRPKRPVFIRLRATLASGLLIGNIAAATAAEKHYGPGVTDTEIRIGQTMPYSGPASALGTVGRTELAFFDMLNAKGGINGRKVRLISLDDGYSPPKTVEQTRRLVEQEQVLALFGSIGTPTNAAVQTYLNERKVPQLVVTGAARFNDPERYPWTMPLFFSYRAEAHAYAHYLLAHKPTAKIAVLYQNDDYGKDYLEGLKEGLGSGHADMIVASASYEATDPTVDSQMIALQASGADVLLNAAGPKFAAQAIRRAYDSGWQPLQFLNSASAVIQSVLKPAGFERSIGLVTVTTVKSPSDPQWRDDPDYRAYLAFMKEHFPDGNPDEALNFVGYSWAHLLAYLLERCGDDLTRENFLYQATHLDGVRIPMLLPGITFHSTPTDRSPIKQVVLARFDGEKFARVGEPFGADEVPGR
jgi:ABC-type branched-subunit amino acid transport system substrate-binding protein